MGNGLSAVVMAMIIESKLIQRLEKSRMEVISSANTGNRSFCLGLVHVKNIHALFGIGYHVSEALLLNHAYVPLRKKN